MARDRSAASDLSRKDFARILLVKPSSLGDVVHALPVLHGLRLRYPQARIDWLIASSLAPLLEDHPELDELVRFDRKRFGRVGLSPRASAAFVRFVRDLRARKYDLVIDLQGLFRTGFLTHATGAPVRIGYSTAREGASMFYTHRVAVADADMHAVDRNYLVAQRLGFGDVPVTFKVAITDAARAAASSLLQTRGAVAGDRLVLVVPGARWETKRWLPGRFAETIDRLHAREGISCVLAGSGDEVALCEKIGGACATTPMNLAGQTNLRELTALVERSDVVLCHDSAVMHLAVASGRALVCLIGPTNARRTGPYRREGDVIRLDLDCAPCYLRRLAQCPHDHRCMRDLDVSDVVAATERALLADEVRVS